MNVRRSRFLIPVLVLMLGAMALAACGESDGPELPDTTAASVIAYLDEVDYQESWELWPGLGEKVEGGEPHGMLLTTYLNPIALKAFNDKAGTMPDGAIIVKENYTPDGTLAANTVMYKKSGYNPDHNDWYWLKVLADGTVDKQGMVEGCQNCHGEVRDNDYVWTELLISSNAGRGSNKQPESHAASRSCWSLYERSVQVPSGANISVDGACRSSKWASSCAMSLERLPGEFIGL